VKTKNTTRKKVQIGRQTTFEKRDQNDETTAVTKQDEGAQT